MLHNLLHFVYIESNQYLPIFLAEVFTIDNFHLGLSAFLPLNIILDTSFRDDKLILCLKFTQCLAPWDISYIFCFYALYILGSTYCSESSGRITPPTLKLWTTLPLKIFNLCLSRAHFSGWGMLSTLRSIACQDACSMENWYIEKTQAEQKRLQIFHVNQLLVM